MLKIELSEKKIKSRAQKYLRFKKYYSTKIMLRSGFSKNKKTSKKCLLVIVFESSVNCNNKLNLFNIIRM